MKRTIRAAAMSILLVGVPMSYACNRGPDVKEQVQDSLKQANIDDVNVDWDKKENIVHLKGSVDSTAERQRAEQVAAAAVGHQREGAQRAHRGRHERVHGRQI